MVVELPWIEVSKDEIVHLLLWFSLKWLGREVVQRHPDLTDVTRPQQSKAPCQWVILLGCLQISSWHRWLAINLKLWELGVKTQEMQKPLLHDLVVQKIPNIWLTCEARKDMIYPGSQPCWEPSLVGSVSHKENTLWGFAEDFIPKWKIFTHIKLKKILC